MTSTPHCQKGFSLVELLVSVAILMFMMAVVFREVNKLQAVNVNEDMKRDIVQNARETLDQLSRDVHSAGFPSKRLVHSSTYTSCNVAPCTPVAGTPENNKEIAVAGFVVIAPNEFVVEGDVDGDGFVDSVGYRVVPGPLANFTCPCLQRSQVNKLSANPLPTGYGGAQITTANYSTILDNVVAPANNVYFTYYDRNGGVITPPAGGLMWPDVLLDPVRTVQLQLRVQTRARELDRNFRPQMAFTITAKMGNY